ncbi:IS630 family transposase [Magnetofaba australis]|uniref:IS630 family transposase n=1 Tax=Magnetofaba australis TaxID=1472297 RepID=UPI0039C8F47F
MTQHTPLFALTDAQRSDLDALLRAAKTPQSVVQRIRIVLRSSEGLSPADIAEELGVSRPTVYRWRGRFQEHGVDGLSDAPRSGQPRKLTEQQVQMVLQATVDRVPHEATHWSVRLMADYAGITTWQVRQIWDAAGLKPHRLKNFKISNDPEFAECWVPDDS